MRTSLMMAILTVFALVTSACAGDTATPAPPPVELGAPTADAQTPVRDAPLMPGGRYRFTDVLPGIMNVELTAPDPAVVNYSQPDLAVLSTTANLEVDVVWFVDPADLRVPLDPYFSSESLAGPDDEARLTAPAPNDLLDYASRLPFATVTQPVRPVTVAGQPGRAVDIRIADLPPDAQRCAQDSGAPCAWLLNMPGIGQTVHNGEQYRVMVLDVALPHLAPQPLLITQNLGLPAAQAVLDSVAFTPRR